MITEFQLNRYFESTDLSKASSLFKLLGSGVKFALCWVLRCTRAWTWICLNFFDKEFPQKVAGSLWLYCVCVTTVISSMSGRNDFISGGQMTCHHFLAPEQSKNGGPAHTLRKFQTLIHSYIFSIMVHLGDWKLHNFLFRKKSHLHPEKSRQKTRKNEASVFY